MGLNYALVVSTLFQFRDRLPELSTKKNKNIIKYFQETAFDPNDEETPTPELKEIAQVAGLSRPKVNEIVRDLYAKLLDSFNNKPIAIKQSTITVHISFTWEEIQQFRKNDVGKEFLEQQVSVNFNLPIVPRIGESIRLDFLDSNFKYAFGEVYHISHELSSDTQTTILWVHPTKNYYDHWVKLKEKHEAHERWLRRLEIEKKEN